MQDDWNKRYEEWKSEKARRAQANNKDETPTISSKVEEVKEIVQKDIQKTEQFIEKEEKLHPIISKTLFFLAFAIPIIIILTILYLNYLPFGYEKSYLITIEENGTINSSDSNFYIQDIKGNKITNLSNIYDYGVIYIILDNKVVLRNASVDIQIEGDEVYLPYINFDKNNLSWYYNWEFSSFIPSQLEGTTQYNSERSCIYFNSSNNNTLSYPNSKDLFEGQGFILSAEWMPTNKQGINQQIIGHYNWELWQNNNSVIFMVGRLTNITGPLPSLTYNIKDIDKFYNNNHSALAIYMPDKETGKGYMELWVDGSFVSRKNIENEQIWNDYNNERNLTFGWSPHNYESNSYFDGCIYNARFNFISKKDNLLDYPTSYNLSVIEDKENSKIIIPIVGKGDLKQIKLNISNN